MFADTNESETVFAPVIQAGVEAFKVSHSVTSVNMKWERRGLLLPLWVMCTAAIGLDGDHSNVISTIGSHV